MAGPVARQGTIPGLIARNNQEQYKPRKGAKIGSPDRGAASSALSDKRPSHYTVHYEDGSSVRMSPVEHKAFIMKQVHDEH